jgi:antitoxin (DNA-binding transcriptional repressor) of toxin-antitoxin stability system
MDSRISDARRATVIPSQATSSSDQEKAMSTSVTMEKAHALLPELIAHLARGEELVITQDDIPVARLVREPPPPRRPRRPGNCKGMITLLVEDDEHLEGFAEYMG